MNMFARKQKPTVSLADAELNRKKCAGKFLDLKKDVNSRLKYLKMYIDSCDNMNELKQFFDVNYSQIYFIFYESFVNVEANIKQKLNKLNKDELETVLYVFQKILILQPERLHQRWQVRSIGRIIQKLLHMGNTKSIKFCGARLFLIWYQILNVNRTHVEELMFQKLIQGFDTFHSSVQLGGGILNSTVGIDMLNAEAQKIFNYDPSSNFSSNSAASISIGRSIYPFEIVPIIPVQPNEQQAPSQSQQSQQQQSNSSTNNSSNNIYYLTAEMLRKMLEYMQQDCMTIEWYGDKLQQSQRCYEFLFEEFKRFYLRYMFPNVLITNSVRNLQYANANNQTNTNTSSTASNYPTNNLINQQQNAALNVYSNFDLLVLLNEQTMPSFERPILGNLMPNDEKKLAQLNCKEEIIKWLISVLLIEIQPSNQLSTSTSTSGINTTNSTSFTGSSSISEYGSTSTIGTLTKHGDGSTLKANNQDEFNDFESSLFDFPSSVSSFMNASQSTSSISSTSTITNSNTNTNGLSNVNKSIIQKVILSSTSNVNLIHEILRNTYFLNFDDFTTVQRVLTAYKKWFLNEAKMPSFMQEPPASQTIPNTPSSNNAFNPTSLNDLDNSISLIDEDSKSNYSMSDTASQYEKFQRTSSVSSSIYSSISNNNSISTTTTSITGEQTRIGYVRCLQIFFYHSSNLLLNRTNLQRDKIENICCYTLEIYKLFIRKLKMDSNTWTLLITILLRVSDFMFNSEYLTSNRNDPATSHLIKLITETVLLAIIKSSFSFNLSNDLWDQLMHLLSIVSSNNDVIDKWIEVIDDLIRQVIKSCYNIDINNLPLTSYDQKRKIKKKILTNVACTTPTSASSVVQSPSNTTTTSTSNLTQNTNTLAQQIQQKRESTKKTLTLKTKQQSEGPTILNATPALLPIAANNQANSSLSINPSSTNTTSNNSSTSNLVLSTSLPLNDQTNTRLQSNSNTSNSSNNTHANIGPQSGVQPLLTRQRTLPTNELDSVKSPSLTDEHFLGINGNGVQKMEEFSTIKSPKTNQSYQDPNNHDNIHTFDDEDDETFDKSATLKANVNNNLPISLNYSPKENSNSKTINRNSSEKSIYYSSELLNDNVVNNNNLVNNNNTSLNIDDNESNSSGNSQFLNNNSISQSPPQLIQPSSIANTKLSPLQQIQQTPQLPSQQPPPLPPLPPSLASKYNLAKIQIDTELIRNANTNINLINANIITTNATPNNVANNSENGIKPIMPPSESNNNLDQVDNTRNERKIKGTSTCSDLDVYFKDYINNNPPQVDTNSESMSGGELSGDTFASPNTNTADSTTLQMNQYDAVNASTLASSLLQQNSNNTSLANESLNSSAMSANTGASSISIMSTNGLLSIDSRINNDERSASFIDTKYIQSSKSATLTPNNVNQSNDAQTNSNHNNNNINSNLNSTTIANNSVTNNNVISMEVEFKETSYYLIKRLFGCLGNLNAIKDPAIHKRVFEFIYNKWERLGKIKDDYKLNDISQIILPISYFSPWLFEAIYQLPYNYQYGKLIAYKTICRMVIRSATIGFQTLSNDFDAISNEFMDLFYMTIHQGLRSDDRNIINCIIQNCGTKFWHCMLPSCTLLLKDFIDACAYVDSQGPKLEAASILGCLTSFPDYFGDMKVLNQTLTHSFSNQSSPVHSNSSSNDENLTIDFYSKEEIKNFIIQNLTSFSDDCANTNSRCVILCSLTCFIYDEVINNRWNSVRLNEAIKRIFKDLDFREQFNPVLVKMSCDNLRFLSVLANIIFQNEIQYAINIINELNQCLVKLINSKPPLISEDYEKAIISNMFALLEWCMSMPLEQLKDQDRGTLLRNNFKLISHIAFTFKPNESIESEHIHLSAKFIITHLLNQLNHFPFGSAGPTKIVSTVNETNDIGLNLDELSPILFEQPNIQFFTANNHFLISFIELPMKNNEQFFSTGSNLKASNTICRFIVRDFSGKNCWDCCLLNSPDDNHINNYFLDIPFKKSKLDQTTENLIIDSDQVQNSTIKKSKNFDFTQLPYLNQDDIPKDIDILDNILKYISFSSPECRLEPKKPLNIVWDLHPHLSNLLNIDEVKQKMINQSGQENKYSQTQHDSEMQQLQSKQLSFVVKDKTLSNHKLEINDHQGLPLQSYFHLCKSFVHQMGLLSWEKRQSFNLLSKTPQLLRELKSLDDQTCRETHKIALIYIAEGQEEKASILSNERGSQDYEDFLNSLAWAVDLDTHEGFMGGLQHNFQLKTAPYYSNSICEVLFHVSTQMNNPNDQNKISKWRHLGNDSVQIIWSEHTRDYDRSILATEFADVIICIYPLKNGLFRIQINKKPSVGYFGPLFDGAIINKQSLPTLIRATAINANRILLSNTKGYQDFFVHRTHTINNIIKTLTVKQTSEQFIADIYAPSQVVNQTSGTQGQLATNMALKKEELDHAKMSF